MKKQKVFSVLLACMALAALALASCDALAGPSAPGGNSRYRVVTQTLIGSDQEITIWKYSYNNDGSLRQVDNCDSYGYVVSVTRYTNDSAGRYILAETVRYGEVNYKTQYEYENGVLKKAMTYNFADYSFILNGISEYTFSQGKKTQRTGFNSSYQRFSTSTFSYDNSGRRTSTLIQYFDVDTGAIDSTSTSYRTYNSNGTINTVVLSDGQTRAFEWEERPTMVRFDDYFNF